MYAEGNIVLEPLMCDFLHYEHRMMKPFIEYKLEGCGDMEVYRDPMFR